MSITLHQAAEDLRALLDNMDPSTGEMDPGFEPARELVAKRATAVAAYILQTEREADMAAQYVKELQQRIKAQQSRAKWLRGYLAAHMAAAGVSKISDERSVFSAKLEIGRDKAVEVFDAKRVPAEYMRTIPATQEPDKRAIGTAIDAGVDVPGARVVARDRLTIR